MRNFFILLSLSFVVLTVNAQYYVCQPQNYTGGNGFGNWQNASNDLQAVICDAQPGAVIYVERGPYEPWYPADQVQVNVPAAAGGIPAQNLGSMDNAFVLKDNITIIGGCVFRATQITIAGYSVVNNTASRLYNHLLIAPGISNCEIHNFEIRRGNADQPRYIINLLNGYTIEGDRGGAFYIISSSDIRMKNMRISYNDAEFFGGGIYCESSDNIRMEQGMIIRGNIAKVDGGGMYFRSSKDIHMDDMEIVNNEAQQNGGGVYFDNSNEIHMHQVIILNNHSQVDGGGIYNNQSDFHTNYVSFKENWADGDGGGLYNNNANPHINHMTSFDGNTAHAKGGGICNFFSNPNIDQQVTISNNTAYQQGGGMYNDNSNPIISETFFINNTADQGGGMFNDNCQNLIISDIKIYDNNNAKYGGGIYNMNTSLTLEGTLINENNAAHGGGVFNENSSVNLSNRCEIIGNSAYYEGGGMYNHKSQIEINQAIISENSVTTDYGRGAGIYNENNSKLTAWNLLLADNEIVNSDEGGINYGGGMYNENSEAYLYHTTCVNNIATTGSQIYNASSIFETYNSIIWEYSNSGSLVVPANNTDYSNSLAKGITVAGINNNLNGATDPKFINPNPHGNYHLDFCSPCSDVGDFDYSTSEDLENHARIGIPDLGAYEFQDVTDILYVMQGAAGNGSRWDEALGTLEEALHLAHYCTNITQIWVATGIYRPGYEAEDYFISNPTQQYDSTDNAFVLPSNVAVYGGFAGTETSLDQRNIANNPTILDGDMGSGTYAYHVVIAAGISNSLLDGFTIQNGNAAGTGNFVTINNEDVYDIHGGGIYLKNATVNFYNLTITDNHADENGAGMFIETADANIDLHNSLVSNNTAGIDGGGIYAHELYSFTVENTEITDNEATENGAGMYIETASANIGLYNSVVSNNTAEINGGGIYASELYSFTVDNTEITDNIATQNGGGVYANDLSNFTMDNTKITDNTATNQSGGGIYANELSNFTVNNTLISDNTATQNGGGIYANELSDFTMNSTKIIDNTATQNGGGIYAASSALNFKNDTIERNNATSNTSSGGGLYLENSNAVQISNSIVWKNRAYLSGGGFYINSANDTIRMDNVVIAKDTVGNGDGGGIYNNDAILKLTNLTIADNRLFDMNGDGAGIYNVGNEIIHLYNTILWMNLNSDGDQNSVNSLANFHLGDNLIGVIGNINGNYPDPKFTNPALDNYRLKSNSTVCIGAGDNAVVNFDTDLDELPRIIGTNVDYGAYEHPTLIQKSFSGEDDELGIESISGLDINWELQLYPNPISQGRQAEVRLHSNNLVYDNQVHVQIFSIDGRSISQQSYSTGNFQLDVSTLVAGMYIVNLRTEDGKAYNSKFVISD